MGSDRVLVGRGLVALLLVSAALLPARGAHPMRAMAARSLYGGTLIATTSADPGDFDPAISYGWADYNLLHNIFNGLLGYAPDSTTLVPDIAARWPAISPDGLTWTFTLRHGVMFQPPVNREVHAADFKYSWERVLNPKTASPAVTFFQHIVGAGAYNAGKAKDVAGIRVLGPYSLQIRLVKPYVPFKYILALTFADVVPHEIADKYPKDFSHHAVGTGAFMLRQWIPSQRMVFVRNPHYFHHGLPYLDKVILNIGVLQSVAILQVQRGQADVPTDELTGLDYLRLRADPRWSSRVFRIPSVAVSYLFMNNEVPPFDNRLVRQAVAMTIDKARVIKVATAGLGKATSGVLPPLMPCYNPHLRGWPHDLARARRLLARAGYPHGFKTTIMAGGTNVTQATEEQVEQRDLARIGIAAQIKVVNSTVFGTLLHTPKAIAMANASWTLDYPDPSDFIDPLLTSAEAVYGGANASYYRNKTVDALASRADQEQDQARRCALYHRIEQIVVDDAPWVPLYTPEHATLVSRRVTRFYMNPIWYEFDFAYYRVGR